MTVWATWCELCDTECDVHPVAHIATHHAATAGLSVDMDPARHVGYIHRHNTQEDA